jgi:acetyl-CoA carboxylase biotin carboxyl carrier protein
MASNPQLPSLSKNTHPGEEIRRQKSSSGYGHEHLISTPLSGVFYRHPGPGKPPYVAEGDTVGVGQALGLVEIMKQFSEVRSTASGMLDRFTVDDCSEVCAGAVVAVVTEHQ